MSFVVMPESIPLILDENDIIRVGEADVTLNSIMIRFREGATAEEIVQQYPSLNLADVYLVIGYYLRHQDEINKHLCEPQQPSEGTRQERNYTSSGVRRGFLGQAARAIVLVWPPVLILLGLAKLFSLSSDVTLRQLTQDTTTVLDGPFYVGIISNIGVLLWTAAASICLFTPLFLSKWVDKAWRYFFLVSGLLTVVLLLDDFFLLHDEVFPMYLGVSGDIFGASYALFMLVYLLRFRTFILQNDYVLLAMALAVFAVSAGVDLASPILTDVFPQQNVLFFEDGTKLLGIATWLAYHVYLTASVLSEDSTTSRYAQ